MPYPYNAKRKIYQHLYIIVSFDATGAMCIEGIVWAPGSPDPIGLQVGIFPSYDIGTGSASHQGLEGKQHRRFQSQSLLARSKNGIGIGL